MRCQNSVSWKWKRSIKSWQQRWPQSQNQNRAKVSSYELINCLEPRMFGLAIWLLMRDSFSFCFWVVLLYTRRRLQCHHNESSWSSSEAYHEWGLLKPIICTYSQKNCGINIIDYDQSNDIFMVHGVDLHVDKLANDKKIDLIKQQKARL